MKLFQELILIFNTIDVERIEVKKILLGNDILNSKLRIISFIFYSTLFLNYIFLVFIFINFVWFLEICKFGLYVNFLLFKPVNFYVFNLKSLQIK